MKIYVATYFVLMLATLALLLGHRKSCTLFDREYLLFLRVPWKVATFLTGASGLAIMAPYTGDPTWDYADALFMSFFTFMSAPWSLGTIWLVVLRRRPLWELFAAACLMLFSASWSYDLYLLWRDGQYPPMWRENLGASSFLYILAGLFWNLEWREGRGVTFAFLHPGWPSPPAPHPFRKIVWYVLPVALLVTGLMVMFVIFHCYS